MVVNDSTDLISKTDSSPKIFDIAENTSNLMMQGTYSNKISRDLAKATSDKNLASERKSTGKVYISLKSTRSQSCIVAKLQCSNFIIDKRGPKQSKLKDQLKPTASRILNSSSPHTIKDWAKVIQKRRKEQEMVWKVKWDNSKKSFANLFSILTTNIKQKQLNFSKKEIVESIK